MKILVYGVYAVELLQTTLLTKVVSKQFATYFGNFAVLDEIWIPLVYRADTELYWCVFIPLTILVVFVCLQVLKIT